MTPAEFIEKYDPCSEAADWLGQFSTTSAAWDACECPDWLFWALARIAPLPKEMSARLAARFVRETPVGGGRTVWGLLTDVRSRAPILAIERGEDVFQEAWAAARKAEEEARAAARAAACAACAACAAARKGAEAADAAAWAAEAAEAAARAAACAAESAEAAAAAWSAESAEESAEAAEAAEARAEAAACAAQCRIIREEVENPFFEDAK